MAKNQRPASARQPAARQSQQIYREFTIPFWIALGVFLLATLVLFQSQIFGHTFFWEDFTEYVYPIRSFMARHLAEGVLPFWNPYTFNGMPFIADIQTGVFYPPHLLMVLFVRNGHLPVLIVEMSIILHIFIAQIAMYLLCRHWRISSFGSMLAAISYAFSGMLLCHTIHPMIVYHLAWFPLIVLHFHKAITHYTLKNALLAGLLLGMTMLSGHPQMTLYLVFCLFLCTLWFGIAGIRAKEIQGKDIGRFALLAALPIIVGTGLFLIQLLPSNELAQHSEYDTITYEYASEGSMQIKQVLTAVVPKLFGTSEPTEGGVPYYLPRDTSAANAQGTMPYFHYWETTFYFGIPALLFGLLGAMLFRKTRLGGFLIAIAIFSFLFALGANGFLLPVFYNLPLFNKFRMPGRMMFVFVFAFTALAGLAFDALGRREILSSKLFWSVVGALLLVAIGTASGTIPSIIGTPEQFLSTVKGYGLLALFLVVSTGAIAYLFRQGRLSELVAGSSLLVLAIIDLTLFGSAFNSNPSNPEEAYKLPPAIENLMSIHPPDSLFRVQMRNERIISMKRNQGLVSNIMLYEGYNHQALNQRVPPAPNTDISLDLLNVRYTVKVDSVSGGAYYVERPHYFPHARMLYKARVLSREQMETTMKSGTVDFANEIMLEKNPSAPLPSLPQTEVANTVRCTAYDENSFTYSVSTAKNGILDLSELWYPAWVATLDGQPVEVLRANWSMRGIEIPAGQHIVRMVYSSAPFRTGAWATSLTLGVTSLLLLWIQIRNSKRTLPVNEQ